VSALVIIGGGIAGLSSAMLLARDGHHVTVLERDPAPPTEPADSWAGWERRGVTQFRGPHGFLPRFRALLEVELPDVVSALDAEGALRANRIADLPAAITGGWRDGDERFEQLTGRRPLVEAVLARRAAREPGVTIRRGAAVAGLLTDDGDGAVPRVTGVVLDGGERLPADLVIDAGGRRSALPDWLEASGATRPVELVEDGGSVYYWRDFRRSDGTVPAIVGPILQHYDSISVATLAADNGHWSVAVVSTVHDHAMRAAREEDVWDRLVASYPLAAHWCGGEAIGGVGVMAAIVDRQRCFMAGERPVATGVVAIGDASACTTPSLGRGASIALVQAVCLRDVLHDVDAGQPGDLAAHWHATTAQRVSPLVEDTLRLDRHRRAQIEAQIDGRAYDPPDPAWHLGQTLAGVARRDPDLLRGYLALAAMVERGADVFGRPGFVDKVMAAGPPEPLPGPSRRDLVGIIGEPTGRASRSRTRAPAPPCCCCTGSRTPTACGATR